MRRLLAVAVLAAAVGCGGGSSAVAPLDDKSSKEWEQQMGAEAAREGGKKK